MLKLYLGRLDALSDIQGHGCVFEVLNLIFVNEIGLVVRET